MKHKKGIFVIFISIIMIFVGVTLLALNEDLDVEKGKTIKEPNIKPFTKIDIRSCLYEKINMMDEKNINVGNTSIIAYNSDKTKYLVHYQLIMQDGSTKEYESIVTVKQKKEIEYPGWDIGSKTLDEYGFIYESQDDYVK